ncbi:hypothetical protein CLG96_05320 [Sphingomonas oleivorans]|uniref:Uncharacterized protein n=2 Tax=Sphingomonas oleivorans TaxID=1735121 RepID=A0A2T5FZ79_9SPHN|nr:hypothetical protein CLG96_05320 [Sphingomonas oleivorans]
MVDRWTDSLFWPSLIGAWAGVLVGMAAALMRRPLIALVLPTTIMLGAMATIMFVLMLLDAPTRRAVNAFNSNAKKKWREMTWWERLFSSEYGDRRLLIVNRLVWLELAVFIFVRRQDLALLGFMSFAISTIMLMLMMKRRSTGALVNVR